MTGAHADGPEVPTTQCAGHEPTTSGAGEVRARVDVVALRRNEDVVVVGCHMGTDGGGSASRAA
jgi:hypothetical protein